MPKWRVRFWGIESSKGLQSVLYIKETKYLYWKFKFHLLFVGCTTNAVIADGTDSIYKIRRRNTINIKLMRRKSDEREYYIQRRVNTGDNYGTKQAHETSPRSQLYHRKTHPNVSRKRIRQTTSRKPSAKPHPENASFCYFKFDLNTQTLRLD